MLTNLRREEVNILKHFKCMESQTNFVEDLATRDGRYWQFEIILCSIKEIDHIDLLDLFNRD